MMTIDSFFTDGEINEYCWDYVRNLAKVVALRYFKYRDVEDLISLSLVDCISFIKENRDNKDIRNVRSFLFTRIRNVMGNHLYSYGREIPTEDTSFNQIEGGCLVIDDLEYKFNSAEEARELSLKVWRTCNERTW